MTFSECGCQIDNEFLQTSQKKINSLTENQVENMNQAIHRISTKANKYEKG